MYVKFVIVLSTHLRHYNSNCSERACVCVCVSLCMRAYPYITNLAVKV